MGLSSKGSTASYTSSSPSHDHTKATIAGKLANRQLELRLGAHRAKIQKFWDRCTLHGINEIRNATSWPLKIFWLTCFFAALTAAVYGCVAIVIEYLQAPVVVSYFVHDAKTLYLPDIVVCPFNRFNASYFDEVGISDTLADYIEISFGKGGNLYEFQHNLRDADDKINELNANELGALLHSLNLTFTQFVDKASLTCESIFRYCVQYSQFVSNCCSDAIPMMTSAGRCYRINGTRQDAPGYGYGLTMVIDLPYTKYRPSPNNMHIDGVMVKLAEKGKGTDYDIAFVSAGTHALMPLRATNYSFMNDPPRYVCKENTEAYSRVSCFDDCLFERGRANCHCSHIASNRDGMPICSPYEYQKCLIPETQMHWKELNDIGQDLIAGCREKCGPACEYWQYTASVSYANFPAPTIYKFINYTSQKDYNNSIILEVFYERLEYTWIKHRMAMTADTFIANLGGQIGLWVGGSILTILQVLVFVVQLLVCKPRNKPLHKSLSSKKPSPKRASNARNLCNNLSQLCSLGNGCSNKRKKPYINGSVASTQEENLDALLESVI